MRQVYRSLCASLIGTNAFCRRSRDTFPTTHCRCGSRCRASPWFACAACGLPGPATPVCRALCPCCEQLLLMAWRRASSSVRAYRARRRPCRQAPASARQPQALPGWPTSAPRRLAFQSLLPAFPRRGQAWSRRRPASLRRLPACPVQRQVFPRQARASARRRRAFPLRLPACLGDGGLFFRRCRLLFDDGRLLLGGGRLVLRDDRFFFGGRRLRLGNGGRLFFRGGCRLFLGGRRRSVGGRCLRERLPACHHEQDAAKHAGARGDGGR